MNSSPEFWEIDGVSLHQYGWSVTTLGGSRIDLPPRRGENIKLANRRGTKHRPKIPDSRILSLQMWVTGADPATGIPAADQVLRWNDSWDFLKRLVWKSQGRQVTLTRRQWLTVDGTPTMVIADALVEISDTMSPTMTGRTRADFVMNLLMADPFFYDRTQRQIRVDLDTPTSIDNPGHDDAIDMEIDFVGKLTAPTLTNATPEPNVWVKSSQAITAGRTVRLDVGSYQANYIAGAIGTVLGSISHAGSLSWMKLEPEGNLVTLTSTSGSDAGHALVRYRPVYV